MATWLRFMVNVSMNIVQNLLLIQNQGANVGGKKILFRGYIS